MAILLVQTYDNEQIEVDAHLITTNSVTIKNMLEDMDSVNSSENKEAIPLPNPSVTAPVLRKMIEFWKLSSSRPPYKGDEDDKITYKTTLADWQLEYCGLPIGEDEDEDGMQCLQTKFEETETEIVTPEERNQITFMCQILEAANYLECKYLMDVVSRALAILLVGQIPSTMRKVLQLPSPYTPEEEAELLKQIKLV